MQQLTRLINYKTKKSTKKSNIKTYNPFDTGTKASRSDGNDEMSHSTHKPKTRLEPKVHKYHKANSASPIVETAHTKTKGGGGTKFLMVPKKSKQADAMTTSSKRSSTSAAPATIAAKCNGNNSINYTSLNRMRNSNASSCASHTTDCRQTGKRKWQFLLWKCCRNRKRKSQQYRRKKTKRCWNFLKKFSLCLKRQSASSASSAFPFDSDDDDDIDAKFTAYIMEMQERDAREDAALKLSKVEASCITKSLPSMMTPQLDTNLLKTNPKATESNTQPLTSETFSAKPPPPPPTTTRQPTSAVAHRVSFLATGCANSSLESKDLIQRRHSQYQMIKCGGAGGGNMKRRAWTWDDSLRSNSDRFLETLEEDEIDFVIIETASTSVNSSRCSFNRTRPSLQQMLTVSRLGMEEDGLDVGGDFVIINGEEAKAAAEELSCSPVMGQRGHDPASSPLQSRGSASSENWPQQSDEDIDRLVAMHQNRSSLSSLGLRSDSMASVYSGAGEGRYGTVVVKGQVEFGMQYNYKLGALEIHVVRCKDLAAVDTKRNRSDPYVKVYLLPDKSKAGKRKTKVKKHTLNPIFDEVLRFHMPISSLESRTLWLTVWHSDMFGRNDFLGEVSVNLQGRVFDNPQSQWYLLQERSEPFDEVATYRGDIVVGLKYVPPEGSKPNFMRSTNSGSSGLRKFGSIKSVATSKTDRSAKGGQLHVLVKEAKHLTPIKPNGTCDAFCKSYLLPDRTRSSKQKTPIVKRSTNPSWTYTFVYEDVSLEDLSERALELTVWDHDRLASNEFLGGVRFSLGTGKSYGRLVDWMDASGKELSLWQSMLDRPNFWVEGSVILRSSLDGIRAIP